VSRLIDNFKGQDTSVHRTKVAGNYAEEATNVDVSVDGVLRPRLGLAYVSENPVVAGGAIVAMALFDRLNQDPVLVLQTADGTLEYLDTFVPTWSEYTS